MKTINFGDVSEKAAVGDMVNLQKLAELDVVRCEKTGVPMLNIDADQIELGDLAFIKKLGLTISNPDTDKPVALGVDYIEESWGKKINDFLTTDDDDDDDSSFFSSTGGFLGGVGSSGFGGSFGGGFGGFGGGSFSGGGASRGF